MKRFLGASWTMVMPVILLGLPIQSYAQNSEWMRQPDSSGHAGQFLRSDFTWRNVVFPFSRTSVSVTDTGAVLIGTTAVGTARFNVTAIYIMTTDTAGYTSNTTGMSIGTAAPWNNLVQATIVPTLRTNGILIPTLSSSRTTIAPGTGIYSYIGSQQTTDPAVATSFHVVVTIVGFYDR